MLVCFFGLFLYPPFIMRFHFPGAFPEPLVRRYAADIIEGLHFLHAKNFIHRDIKPTNLLVSGGRVKLGDFGCSTMLLEDEET
jgi:serine/threonine protein kinase